MKQIALLALLGHISAIQLNTRFIEDVDDDLYVMNKGKMVEKTELAGAVVQKAEVAKTDSKT